jgi:hypothetical protein
MDREDAFWAAKQVAAFTDAEIRALVETGEYSDPKATEWMADCLIKRRNKIAQAWFSEILPLDKFRIADGKLTFEDLSARLGKEREFFIGWASWDGNGQATPLPGATGGQVPAFRSDAQYLVATIQLAANEPGYERVAVYLRHGQSGPEVVGIDR